jgi:hypothetical protein
MNGTITLNNDKSIKCPNKLPLRHYIPGKSVDCLSQMPVSTVCIEDVSYNKYQDGQNTQTQETFPTLSQLGSCGGSAISKVFFFFPFPLGLGAIVFDKTSEC